MRLILGSFKALHHRGVTFLLAGILLTTCLSGLVITPSNAWARHRRHDHRSSLATPRYVRPTCEATADDSPLCVAKDIKLALGQAQSNAFERTFDHVVAQAALHLDKVQPASNKVVLVDLDETLVSNLPYWQAHPQYNPEAWQEWMAQSPKTGYFHNSVKTLIQDAKSRGFSIMFITGRSARHSAFTLRDLEGIAWDGLYFRPEGNKIESRIYKAQVRHLLRSLGYEIVLNLGDQLSDFDLPIETDQGEFLVPNVIYTIP